MTLATIPRPDGAAPAADGHSLALRTLPLSERDRAVLIGRTRLLSRIMQWGYGLVAAGLALALLKAGVSRPDTWLDEFFVALPVAGLFAAPLVAVHAVLAWWERAGRSALREDLAHGFKACVSGCLEGVDDGDESSATWLHLRAGGAVQAFALRTLSDLWRIRPQPWIGQDVVIEYAPKSGVVLALHAVPSSAANGQASP